MTKQQEPKIVRSATIDPLLPFSIRTPAAANIRNYRVCDQSLRLASAAKLAQNSFTVFGMRRRTD
ncbi:hypothetical protein GT037_008594 [Alternaria burnsii]|uniref:Uncharacterized protein n=1 Tax=Alternaria burnsii TaxID=1187904 RepID=A0A8H7B5P8_9PLEO|nr:uncharacterized protein GT037_008594 [Alternaria burnsii]KAF7673271.1 hypothetical protein GT037_008594 [Alternaria burnsii]